MTSKLHRNYVTVLLPTRADQSIDEGAFRAYLKYFLDNKRFAANGGLIINPEAGETFYMSREEKRRTLEIAVDENKGRLPLFAGIFGTTTKEVIELTKDAKAIGAQGLFVMPPGGAMDITVCWDAVKYPEVWIDQIKEQVRVADLPIITHPVAAPSTMWGIGLPLEAVLRTVKEVPNIVGWKMTYSYEGYRRIVRALRKHAPHVGILGASAARFHENYASGEIDGTATGSWCYALESMLDHYEAWQRNDFVAARRVWSGGLSDLQAYVYDEWSRLHGRYKAAAWLQGLVPHPAMRPPMPPMKAEEIAEIRRLLQKCEIRLTN
jgi:4-hydroxy-tetrahydrodipicolinate synthase